MVDHLHRDLAAFGLAEGAAAAGVEVGPGRFVDLGPQGAMELLVGLVGAGEIGVADEEALAVVIGVDRNSGMVPLDVSSRKVFNVRFSRFVSAIALN